MPSVSTDDTVVAPVCVDRIVDAKHGQANELIADKSVALIVATPPAFTNDKTGVSGGCYVDYLAMLENVFVASVRKLQPGGRVAAIINPSDGRMVSADIVAVFERAGLLLRGEIVVVPPTGRSLSRVVIASKDRFDRAVPRRDRQTRGLACVSTISTEEFMEATLDVWHLPPRLVPVRLMNLYTYRDDLVFDPFADDVTNLQAAFDTGRRWFGYRNNTNTKNGQHVDVDDPFGGPSWIEAEPGQPKRLLQNPETVPRYSCQHLSRKYGGTAVQVAHGALLDAGFTNIRTGRGGVTVPKTGTKTVLSASNVDGTNELFDVVGKYTLSKHEPAEGDWLTAVGKATLIHTLTGQQVTVFATGIANNQRIRGCVGRGKPISRVVWLEQPGCLHPNTTP